jgi:hypothetical protein
MITPYYDDDDQSAEERYCHEAIRALQLSFNKAAKPYIDRLVSIRSLRTPTYVIPITDLPDWMKGALKD